MATQFDPFQGLDHLMGQIDATYNDGVLTLSIPIMEEAKPRRIDVKQGSGRSNARIHGSQDT